MNDSLDDVLQRYFDDVARHDHLGDTPVRVVMRRGRRRRARRRTGAMAGTLVIGALGSVVAVRTMSGGDSGRQVQIGNDGNDGSGGGGTPTPVPTDGKVPLSPSPLVWNDVTIGSAEAVSLGEYALPLGVTGGFVADEDGGFYALSTQPGRSEQPVATLYHSVDGIRWAAAGAPTTAIAPRSQIAGANGRLYSVGTQAATAPVAEELDPGELVLARSGDGGATWQDEILPVDLGTIRTLPFVRSVNTSAAVAAGEAGTVVAAVTRATLDVEALVPEGVPLEAMDFWSDPTGAIRREATPGECPSDSPGAPPVTDPVVGSPDGGCMTLGDEVQRYTWAELGVPPETVQASRGQVQLLFAADGETFTSAASPVLDDTSRVETVTATVSGDRFVVFVHSAAMDAGPNEWASKVDAYISTDGRDWSASSLPLDAVSAAGTLADGTLVVAGVHGPDYELAMLRDDAWHSMPVPSAADAGAVPLGWSQRVAIGPMGIAVYGLIADAAPHAPVGVESTVTGMGPASTVVGEALETTTSLAGSARPNGVSTTSTYPGDDPGATGSASTVPATAAPQFGDGQEYDPDTARSVLLFSPDGVTWSADEIDAPTPFGANVGLLVTGDHIAVATAPPGVLTSDAAVPLPDPHVFVGTLA